MKLPRLKIYKERPGVISYGPLWVGWLAHGMVWMYTADTLPQLLWYIATEWKQDRHLVG